MAGKQSAQLERKKFFADPIMVSMIVVLLVFLALFILYPLLMLLVDSFYAEGTITLDVFKRVLNLERFRNAFKNTLTLGFIVGFASTAIGLLFAYVEVYVKLKTKILEKLFGLVSMLPVVSPPCLFLSITVFNEESFLNSIHCLSLQIDYSILIHSLHTSSHHPIFVC